MMQVTEAMRTEAAALRRDYATTIVTRKIDHRDGDATNEQIASWEAAALANWDSASPALASILKESR